MSLTCADGFVHVSIKDNGPGIPEAYQSVIFERFRQGGNTLTDKPQGTGLGLPISREIVEHFGGKLWVESNQQATSDVSTQCGGSNFVFSLPLLARNV